MKSRMDLAIHLAFFDFSVCRRLRSTAPGRADYSAPMSRRIFSRAFLSSGFNRF